MRGECGSLGFSTPSCGDSEHGLACSKRQGMQSFFIVTESYESWSIYSTATQLPSPHSKERQSNHNHNHDAATPATNHVPGSLHAPVAACVHTAATRTKREKRRRPSGGHSGQIISITHVKQNHAKNTTGIYECQDSLFSQILLICFLIN